MNVTSVLARLSPLYAGPFGRAVAALRGPVLEHAAWARNRPAEPAEDRSLDHSLVDSVELSDAALAAKDASSTQTPQADSLRASTVAPAGAASASASTTDAPTADAASANGRDAESEEAAPADGDARAAQADSADSELSPEERKQVEDLRRRDIEVRQHEQAHLAAAGAHARGGPTYEYETGPDGRRYAVGGEVQIDTSPEETPEATIAKMEQVRAAALAPAEPSSQDRAVAAKASAGIQKARAEQAQARGEADEADGARETGLHRGDEPRGEPARGSEKRGAYRRVSEGRREPAHLHEWYA